MCFIFYKLYIEYKLPSLFKKKKNKHSCIAIKIISKSNTETWANSIKILILEILKREK